MFTLRTCCLPPGALMCFITFCFHLECLLGGPGFPLNSYKLLDKLLIFRSQFILNRIGIILPSQSYC